MSLSEGVYKQTEAKKQTQPPGKLGLPLDHLFSQWDKLYGSIQAYKTAINLLFDLHQYYPKNDMSGWVEAKRTRFFEKEKDIHTASWLPNIIS